MAPFSGMAIDNSRLTMKKNLNTEFLKTFSIQGDGRNDSQNKEHCRRVTMKKLMLVAAMVLGFAGMSFAQLSANGAANIDAKLLTGLTMAVTKSVNFGNNAIAAGTLTVTPANGALFTVTGTAGASINVTYPSNTVTLSNTAPGTGSITFGVQLVNSTDGITAGGAAATGSSWFLSGTYPTGTGDAYFLLGGTVTLLGTENAGSYSGTFTLTATYN